MTLSVAFPTPSSYITLFEVTALSNVLVAFPYVINSITYICIPKSTLFSFFNVYRKGIRKFAILWDLTFTQYCNVNISPYYCTYLQFKKKILLHSVANMSHFIHTHFNGHLGYCYKYYIFVHYCTYLLCACKRVSVGYVPKKKSLVVGYENVQIYIIILNCFPK